MKVSSPISLSVGGRPSELLSIDDCDRSHLSAPMAAELVKPTAAELVKPTAAELVKPHARRQMSGHPSPLHTALVINHVQSYLATSSRVAIGTTLSPTAHDAPLDGEDSFSSSSGSLAVLPGKALSAPAVTPGDAAPAAGVPGEAIGRFVWDWGVP